MMIYLYVLNKFINSFKNVAQFCIIKLLFNCYLISN